jgi:hypothetical protein
MEYRNQPGNREWHEFGHAVMWFSPIGGIHNLPEATPSSRNHEGYRNPDSVDSWREGFAEFYSMLVAHFIERDPTARFYRSGETVVNLDYPWPIWQEEEFTVAAILWDLFDSWGGDFDFTLGTGAVEDEDRVGIEVRQLWRRLVSANVQNLFNLWQAFNHIPNINLTFVMHKVYEDLNHDGFYNVGERIGTSQWAVIQTGELIWATTVNPNRLPVFGNPPRTNFVRIPIREWREAKPPVPGSGVLLNLVDKDTANSVREIRVNITVSLPKPYGPYSYVVSLPNSSSTFYMNLPADGNASASIRISSQGYISSEPILVNSSFYLAKVFENIYLLNGTRSHFLTINGTLERGPGAIKTNTYSVSLDAKAYQVIVTSNSTLTNFDFSQAPKQISYAVRGPKGTNGFSTITIPKALMSGTLTVFVNDQSVTPTIRANETHTSLSYIYPHTSRTVRVVSAQVIQEQPSMIIVILLVGLAITLLVAKLVATKRVSSSARLVKTFGSDKWRSNLPETKVT